MRWADVHAVHIGTVRIVNEIGHQRPATQATFTGRMIAVNASSGIHQSSHAVHQPIDLIARAVAVVMLERLAVLIGMFPGRDQTGKG